MIKLSQKAYLLIAVPLCFEIVFVSALITVQEKLNLAVQEQTRLRQTTTILDSILKNLPQCITETGLYQFSHDDRYLKEYQRTIGSIKESLAQLRTLRKDEDDALLNQLDRSLTSALEKVETTHVSFRSENQFQIMVNILRYKSILDHVIKTANELSVKQQEKIDQKEKAEAALRQLISYIAIGGVIISILLSIAIAISFQRLMVRKIAVLSDNGLRLAAGQPLLPALGGDDELSTLDANFHAMADALSYLRSKELALIDNATEIICSLNKKGQFVQVSRAATELLQYETSELIGQSIDSIAATDRIEIEEKMGAIVARASSKPFQVSLKRKDSVVRDYLWSMTWNQKEQTFFCVAHDVTERNRLDQFKRDMIAMVSHDLRSPLSALQVCFDLLADGVLGQLNEKGYQKTQQGIGIIRRLVSKVNALLDIERLESGSITLLISEQNMQALVERSIESIQSLAERKKISFKKVSGPVATIECDADRITDLLINFLHNAVKYSPKGGIITASITSTSSEMEVFVADQGQGVPEVDREVIFERFRQSESDTNEVKAQGSGLGLAIAKAVVNAHGGTIGVRPNYPNGSIFWFKIPLKQITAPADPKSGAMSTL